MFKAILKLFTRHSKIAKNEYSDSEEKFFAVRVELLKQNPLFRDICRITNNPEEALRKLSSVLAFREMEGINILYQGVEIVNTIFDSKNDYKWQKVAMAAFEQIFFEEKLKKMGIGPYSKN